MLVKTKIEEKAQKIYKDECEKRKKLKCFNQKKKKKKKKKYKIKIKRKWYIDILQQTRILFKLRTGMINVRNNVKNKYVET